MSKPSSNIERLLIYLFYLNLKANNKNSYSGENTEPLKRLSFNGSSTAGHQKTILSGTK